MARDNFPKKVVEQLRTRVAYRCSNPDCRVPTVAAGTKAGAVTSIGVAAHIHAAAKGGPRYLAEMTKQDRGAIDNGIWLCSSCSTKIDRDVARYRPETLRQWKADAEAQAIRELGVSLPTERSATDQIAMALTGLPTSFTPTAIQNVHSASSQALERLDPRFRVDTTYRDRMTVFTLHAKETVPFSIKANESYKDEWRSQLFAMLDHGETASIGSECVQLLGSPLFDQVFGPSERIGGKLTIAPSGKPAIAKVALINEETHQVIALDDIHGVIVAGRKSCTFKGAGCEGMLPLSVNVPFDDLPAEASFTLGTSFDLWADRDVLDLPYFEKLASLYQRLTQDWALEVQLEVQGRKLIGARIRVNQTDSFVAATSNLLEYTRRARILASRLVKRIKFCLRAPFSTDDHVNLACIVSILEGDEVWSAENVNSVSCTLIATEEGGNIRALRDSDYTSCELSFVQPAVEPLMVFGQSVDIPDLNTTFSGARPKIIGDAFNFKEGDPVSVEWIPEGEFKLSRKFQMK